jgi:hypothetical protein
VAKINLSRMDFASLITLRKQVENALSERRTTLEKQLAALGGSIASVGGKVARVARGSNLKGKKVAPSIAVLVGKRGRDVAQLLGGLLRQSKKARNWKVF